MNFIDAAKQQEEQAKKKEDGTDSQGDLSNLADDGKKGRNGKKGAGKIANKNKGKGRISSLKVCWWPW